MYKVSAVKNLHLQLKDAHETLNGTMQGVTDKVAAYMPPGKANPIAGTYAHLIMSEDFFIHMLLQQKPPLFASSWKEKTGASEVQPTEWQTAYPKWLKEVQVDIDQMNKYAKAVHEASESYVASLKDDDLLKEVDMSAFGMSNKTVISIISSMVIGHANQITGEISVLKGIQDLKGYPY